MIDFLIIIFAVILLIEINRGLKLFINDTNKQYSTLTIKQQEIFSNKQRGLEEQLEYLRIKDEIKKYDGSFFFNLLFHFACFFIYFSNYVGNVNIFILIGVMFVFCFIRSLLSKSKMYMFIKEVSLHSFIFLYIILEVALGFNFFGFNMSLLHMLPLLLIVKIAYNNLRLKWSSN